MKTDKMTYATYSRDPDEWARLKDRSVLFIDNETQQEVLTMRESLSVLEEALKEEAQGSAVNGPYSTTFMPTEDPNVWYQHVNMQGAVNSLNVYAIRLRSNLRFAEEQFGRGSPGNRGSSMAGA